MQNCNNARKCDRKQQNDLQCALNVWGTNHTHLATACAEQGARSAQGQMQLDAFLHDFLMLRVPLE